MAVPNKTIYVSDGDLKLYQRAQELAGGNLSAAIAGALRRYVDVQEGLREGFDDVVVRVGVGSGRKVRFTGVLRRGVGRHQRQARRALPRLARPRRQVRPPRRAPARLVDGRCRGQAGRLARLLGIGDVRYGSAPKESTLEVVDDRSTSSATRSRPSSSTWSRAPRGSRPWRSSTSDRAAGAGPGRCRSGRRPTMTATSTAAAPAIRRRGRGLRKSYGKQVVLDGIDLDVAEGTVFALLGPERRRQDDDRPHPLDADRRRRRRGPDRRASTSRASRTRSAA